MKGLGGKGRGLSRRTFGVRRLVAALTGVCWPGNGSLLPFSFETLDWFQARRGNPGSELPVWGSIGLSKAAPGRRTPKRPLGADYIGPEQKLSGVGRDSPRSCAAVRITGRIV